MPTEAVAAPPMADSIGHRNDVPVFDGARHRPPARRGTDHLLGIRAQDTAD